jgi:hypothetical protein
LIALAVIATGCTLACALPKSALFSDPVWTEEGMYLVPGSRPGAMFVQHPIPDFSRYSGVMLDEVRIRSVPKLKLRPREISWLTRFSRRVLLRELSRRHGLQVVDAPGPDVLKARLAIIDIDFRRRILWEGRLHFMYPSGRVSMILDLQDSLRSQRLWIYTQSRRLPFYVTPWSNAQIQRVGVAFDSFVFSAMRHLSTADSGELPEPIGPAPNRSSLDPSG